MARKKDIDKMTQAELRSMISDEEKEFADLVKECRNDPVAFGEKMLKIEYHPGQKVWLWLSCQALISDKKKAEMRQKAYDVGKTIDLWKTPEEFMNRVSFIDEEVHPPQRRMIEFLKNILVPSNRWGKTFVTSTKHIWINYYKKGVRGPWKDVAKTKCGTLNLSPHSKQCTAGHEYVEQIVRGELTWVGPDGVAKNNEECKIKNFFVRSVKANRTIYFINNTTYQAVPTGEDQASSLAGTKYLYISYDECAQSLHLKAELPAKIMSRLLDYGGPLDLISTPEVDKPSHQYFSRIAKYGMKAKDEWFTLVGKLFDNVYLGQRERDRILKMIKTTDKAKFRQVAYGEFVSTGAKMFDGIIIERIWNGRTEPELPLLDHKYIVIADWGFADAGDPTVFKVIDYTANPRFRIVHSEVIQGGSPFAVMARSKILQQTWNNAPFIHDASAMGGTMSAKMLRDIGVTHVCDFSATGNKAEMLFFLLNVLSDGRVTREGDDGKVIDENPEFGRLRGYLDEDLEEQLGNYQYNPQKGITDKKLEQDHVMCLGMGIWYLERKVNKRKAGTITFNPLAPTVEKTFPGKDHASIRIRSVDIKERSIMK